MNADEINYLKLKLIELKKLNLNLSKKLINSNQYSSSSLSSFLPSASAYRLRTSYMRHLKYHQKIWLFEFNPIESNNEELNNKNDKKFEYISSKSQNEISSPESNDSGIQSDDLNQYQQQLCSDFCLLYSTVNKQTPPLPPSSTTTTTICDDKETLNNYDNNFMNADDKNDEIIDHVEQHQLPLGWIRCCDDEDSIYYWHKPTGTVQRKPPTQAQQDQSQATTLNNNEKKLSNYDLNTFLYGKTSLLPNSTTTPLLSTYSKLLSNNYDEIKMSANSNSSPRHHSPYNYQLTNDANIYLNINFSDNHASDSNSPHGSSASGSSSTGGGTGGSELITNNDNGDNDDDNDNYSSSTVTTTSSSSVSNSNCNLAKFNRRFHVRSLGWVRINEEDLTHEKCSKAVNKCIHDLSHGFKDYNDCVSKWGEGKDLYIDIEEHNLILVDPIENKPLNKQPITSIRVWGVGRDNGRDFAYVARDKATKIHLCHVFRCEDVPAKEIANTLKEICKEIMLKKATNKSTHKSSKHLRPNILSEMKRQENNENMPFIKFPKPIDEPKKSINCKYIGSIIVNKPSGMDVLNDAIDQMYLASYNICLKNNEINSKISNIEVNNEEISEILLNKDTTMDVVKNQWQNVTITISPSSLYTYKQAFNSDDNDDISNNELLFECRIRYLSFLGISSNVKICGFFEHCADNSFKCHAFYCEPSSAQLCKTVEAACKLRYQKCLDAHPEITTTLTPSSTSTTANNSHIVSNTLNNIKVVGSQLKSMFDLIRTRKKR